MDPKDAKLEGKVVVVTGSGRGIGRTLALAFAGMGARVGLTARTAAEIEAVKAEVEAAGGTAAAVTCDVGDWEQVQAMASSLKDALGNCDVLVNNAGVSRFGSIAKMEPERFDAIMKTNAYGTFYCTRAFLPQMIEAGGGSVVNTSSVAALQGYPAMSVYCMSKAAVNRFTESASAEFQRFRVRVNAVMPTYIRTPLLMSGLREGDEEKFDIKEPDRLIPYFTFFASDALSKGVTGQCVDMEVFWQVEDLIAEATPEVRKWNAFREVLKAKLSPKAYEHARTQRKLVQFLLKSL
ncbi:MAG: hypothetical protein Kow0069_15080 [Promethearchaeota archaeon]